MFFGVYLGSGSQRRLFMDKIIPKKLEVGDTIGFLSASGNIENIEQLERSKEFFERKGYNVVFSDTCFSKYRYMCADDKARIKAIHDFFENDKIDAIVNTRGGYGLLRIADKIDYSIIKKNPKIFVGYSDICILLAMIYKKTGLITFHGPMGCFDFSKQVGNAKNNELTENSFFETLTGKSVRFSAISGFKSYNKGTCEGILWGGNLSTLASMAGLDFIPDEKVILFLEDWHDPVYKIDRMITQLLNLKEFKNNLSGVVLGDFLGIDDKKYFTNLFEEIAQDLKIPIADGFAISHGDAKFTMPYGVNCTFDANNGFIDLTSPFVD